MRDLLNDPMIRAALGDAIRSTVMIGLALSAFGLAVATWAQARRAR